jgi:hypothetical protein
MRIQAILYGTVFSIALALGSFWLGFREGAVVGLLVDAAPRGSMSLHQLESLKNNGLTQNVAIALEGDIDLALLYADQYERHLLHPLLEPIWGIPVSSSSSRLGRLAEYRKLNASPLRAAALAAEPVPSDPMQAAALQQVLQDAKLNDLQIGRMVEKYAAGPISGHQKKSK